MFDCERLSVDAQTEQKGRRALRAVFAGDFDAEIATLIRPSTRRQYGEIGKQIDPDEVIRFGLYVNGEAEPRDWFALTPELAEEIHEENARKANYYGEVQGIVHAFFKETKKPKLVLRELSSRALIDCYFKQEMYHAVVDTMEEPGAVIFVEGNVTEDLAKGVVECIDATEFRPAPDFSLAFYESFIGSKPDITGSLSTEEFVERVRDDG